VGGERVYTDALSGDWFRRAEASVSSTRKLAGGTVETVVNKQVISFDLFYDETVIESNGKRYKPCAPTRLCLTHDTPHSRPSPAESRPRVTCVLRCVRSGVCAGVRSERSGAGMRA